MHEIRATIPPEHVPGITQLARRAGIERVTVAEAYVHGPDARRQVVSVETSTPKARAFVEAVLDSRLLAGSDYSLTSRELRAIVGGSDLAEVTRPMSEPFPNVIQDLWQLSHVTPSYAGRAAAGATLLATGIIDNDPIAIVVAALFLPFLADVLAMAFGLWSRDGRLVRHGLRALIVSTVLAYLGGALVALIKGGPILFAGFRSPMANIAISAAIGVTAGLSSADDTGRRYLIGVAAAVQLAIFPAWFGVASIAGLPEAEVVRSRLISFLLSVVTIALTAVASYAGLHFRKGHTA